MNKSDIVSFFNRLAPNWDANSTSKEPIIIKILDQVGVVEGMTVLDVGCGTGVLFPHYLRRKVSHVLAVDISPEMIRIANEKFGKEDSIEIICNDIETLETDELFDLVMVYNAFPHIPDPEILFMAAHRFLKPAGRFCIAHGMSREAIDAHHHGAAKDVSNGLMTAEDLKARLSPYFDVDILVSDEEKYIVSGTKRDSLQ